MTKDEIKVQVVVELERIQSISGRPCPPITDQTRPLLDLPGFDSLNGIEATSELEGVLGPLSVDNVFASESGKSARTLETIVSEILRAQRGAA
ncbi:MAG: hypothetical protein U0414_31725 [Polyangiaceae bacterium]